MGNRVEMHPKFKQNEPSPFKFTVRGHRTGIPDPGPFKKTAYLTQRSDNQVALVSEVSGNYRRPKNNSASLVEEREGSVDKFRLKLHEANNDD